MIYLNPSTISFSTLDFFLPIMYITYVKYAKIRSSYRLFNQPLVVAQHYIYTRRKENG